MMIHEIPDGSRMAKIQDGRKDRRYDSDPKSLMAMIQYIVARRIQEWPGNQDPRSRKVKI